MTDFDLTLEEPILASVLDILNKSKIEDLALYNVGKRSIVAEWFVIATCISGRQIDALSDEIRLISKDEKRRTIEGDGETGWLLFDLGNVVVHLFTKQQREYYNLDEYWIDTEVKTGLAVEKE
ncbi:MAG: ribosome silencing factor [Candidatus Lindowbacteria bacterium]|nr:ribosome silencing factor [Candidatus Lindowbacteria bacterium]